MNTSLQTLRETYIYALYKENAFLIRKDTFTLHHGGTSHLYLNHNQFLSRFENLDLLVRIYKELLPKKLDFSLGAVDSVMSPVICGMLAYQLRKNIVVIKEKKLEHGLENKVYGDSENEVVLIDDVTSTGTILVNAVKALREKGVTARLAIVSACRDLNAIENLLKEKIKTSYVATYEEIIKTLWNSLSDNEKELVYVEIKEKKYNWKI